MGRYLLLVSFAVVLALAGWNTAAACWPTAGEDRILTSPTAFTPPWPDAPTGPGHCCILPPSCPPRPPCPVIGR